MPLTKKILYCMLMLTIFAFIGDNIYNIAIADNDEHRRKKKKHHGESSEHSSKYLKVVNNAVYKEQCGSCHFAYQPELLPSGGWKKILAEPDKHFGESLNLNTETKAAITGYLETNAAEHSNTKIAAKIIKSLRGQIPIRITDIPYIQKKHRKIGSDTLKRKSIGSLSNCSACHKKAEQGNYDEDYVSIP